MGCPKLQKTDRQIFVKGKCKENIDRHVFGYKQVRTKERLLSCLKLWFQRLYASRATSNRQVRGWRIGSSTPMWASPGTQILQDSNQLLVRYEAVGTIAKRQ
jgi:hypothetical protein